MSFAVATFHVIRRPDGSTITRPLSPKQVDGLACVVCEKDGPAGGAFWAKAPMVPIGTVDLGSCSGQVFAHEPCAAAELPDMPARLTDPDGPEVRERIFRDSQESLREEFVVEGPGASSFGQWRNIR
jgi:hypothetical protein